MTSEVSHSNFFGYKVHPAADVFPMMDETRFKELADDIKAHGLISKIQLFDGQIIDGRNRARACQLIGLQPDFVTIQCENPYSYVWSLNGQRRDLGDIQRSVIFLQCQKGAEAIDAARKEAEERRRAAIAKNQAGNDNAKKTDGENRSPHLFCPDVPSKKPRQRNHDNRSRSVAAKSAGVTPATMQKAQVIVNAGPEYANAVANGSMKPTEALRQVRNTKKLERIKALPDGKYHVIYADPPWQYNDKRETGDHRESTGAEHHYPTMPLSDLKALAVANLAAPDAVLFCWATFPLLPDALEVVKSWGFAYKTAFVWDKGAGAFGHYHNAAAELLLVATRGSGVPQSDLREDQVMSFAREEHSRKPSAWRGMIDRLYPEGPRIELFRRGDAPQGWHVWGAEAEDAAL